MTDCLHLDYETFSECDLKDCGAYVYAEHPSTEIMCASYAFGDGKVYQWIPYNNVPKAIVERVKAQRPDVVIHLGKQMPSGIYQWIKDGKPVRAHNAQFERVITNGTPGKKLGLPKISIEQTVCTACKAASAGLPRDLSGASKALGTAPKDDGGRIAMLQLSKPKKPTKADPSTRWTFENAEDKWVEMLVYNIDDTPAERGIDNALPDLTEKEQKVYELDQRINDRGWRVDRKAVEDILTVCDKYKEVLAEEFNDLTYDWLTGEGLKPTQREKISDWVRANGFPALQDMTAGTLLEVLKLDLPEMIKRVLAIYSIYGAKAISKFQTMLNFECSDGKMRGMFVYHGAATGRWSSKGVQFQNLARPLIEDPERAVELFAQRDIGVIREAYPNVDPIKVAASCVRSCLIASEGHDLMFIDYANIESRVNPWFFGQEHSLEVFRKQDAKTGPDSYKVTYAETFNVPVDTVTKDQRQLGKVIQLFGGYEGGVGAFVQMADTYGVDLEELVEACRGKLPKDALDSANWMWNKYGKNGDLPYEQYITCDALKYLFRKKNPKIVEGWKHLKKAAEMAVEFEGKTYSIPSGKIHFRVTEYKGRKWLNMRLPSGRSIKYFNPSWIPVKTIVEKVPEMQEDGKWITVERERVVPGEMRYWGVDTDTRQWMQLSTYGGKLDENADQGYSRDILVDSLLELDAAGFPICGTVHDEVIMDVPELFLSFDHATRIMTTERPHTVGLPLATEGHQQKRFRK